jgi:hypothetical protein
MALTYGDFDDGELIGLKECRAVLQVGIAIGRLPLGTRVVTVGSKRISFFTNFSDQAAMASPGATRGGKRKPFPGVCG